MRWLVLILMLSCAATANYLHPTRTRWGQEPTVGTDDPSLEQSTRWALGRGAWGWGRFVGSCDGADICVRRGFFHPRSQVGVAIWPGQNNRCDALVLDGDPDLQAYIVAHEVGHCFGLHHNPDQPRSIMFWYLDREQRHWVTDRDLDQLEVIRRGR